MAGGLPESMGEGEQGEKRWPDVPLGRALANCTWGPVRLDSAACVRIRVATRDGH